MFSVPNLHIICLSFFLFFGRVEKTERAVKSNTVNVYLLLLPGISLFHSWYTSSLWYNHPLTNHIDHLLKPSPEVRPGKQVYSMGKYLSGKESTDSNRFSNIMTIILFNCQVVNRIMLIIAKWNIYGFKIELL